LYYADSDFDCGAGAGADDGFDIDTQTSIFYS
jgi:hypothetical protein